MALRMALLVIVAVLVSQGAAHQFSIGRQTSPFGFTVEDVGFKYGPTWGSLHQTLNPLGYSSPITYQGGADFLNSNGNGLSGSFSMLSGTGGEASLRGNLGLLNSPPHKVDGFAQIQSNLDKNWNIVGPETKSFGVTYKNSDLGATASFTQAQTLGGPTKTIAGSIPVVNTDSHSLTLTGKKTFGQQDSLGVKYENIDSGATVSLTGTQTDGKPGGTAGISIPLVKTKDTSVILGAKSTFGQGMKPSNEVDLTVKLPLK